eukprot:6639134-Prymnesium_polylepis.1
MMFAALVLPSLLLALPFNHERANVLQTTTTTTVTCTFFMMEQDALPTQPGTNDASTVGGTGASYAQCVEPPPSSKVHLLPDDATTEKYDDGDLLTLTLEGDGITGHYEKLVHTSSNKVVSAKIVKTGKEIKAERRAKYGVELSASGTTNEMDVIMSTPTPRRIAEGEGGQGRGGESEGGGEGGLGEGGEGG